MTKICVIGLGYIGLPTSIMFAKNGFQVHGVDVNEDVVNMLSDKHIHIEEPGIQEALSEVIDNGNLTVSTTPVNADVFIIAVPSPITEEKTADLDYVRKATESIVTYLQRENLVILESTVPPRTVEDVMRPILEKADLEIGCELYLSHSPERVIPGKVFKELETNDRIIGGVNGTSSELTQKLYKSFVKGEFHLTDATTAEVVKVMENTYRDVNIAFANELAKLSDQIGVNGWEAIKLANFHPRVNIHQPGPGVGGHCIAVDPWFLAELQPEQDSIIKLSRRTNDDMPKYTVERIKQIIAGNKISDPKVALLGLSFKGNVDDMRESPSLKVMENLNKENISYTVFDPHIMDIRVPHQVNAVDEAVEDADLIVILTDHKQFQVYNPADIGSFMKSKHIFDTKNCMDESRWREAGFEFVRLGDAKNR